MIWTTKQGEKIPIKKMGTRHLKNAINMVRKNGFISKSDLRYYIGGPEPNGEMAQVAFWEEFDRVMDAPICKQLGAMERELKTRKGEVNV